MYSVNNLITALQNPRRALVELNQIYHEKVSNVDRVSVLEEDWDNLLILDACRYDHPF